MKDLDFDFSDISGKKETVEKQLPKVERPEDWLPPPKKKTEPAGIMLTFRTENSYDWISKDLAECSSEEFVLWAAEVYPGELNPKHFTTVSARKQGFNDILAFHTIELFNKKPTWQ